MRTATCGLADLAMVLMHPVLLKTILLDCNCTPRADAPGLRFCDGPAHHLRFLAEATRRRAHEE